MAKLEDFVKGKRKIVKGTFRNAFDSQSNIFKRIWNEVYIKPENLQKTGSFKNKRCLQ